MVWMQLPLQEVATLQRGFDLPSRSRKPGDVPIVSSAGISDWHGSYKVAPPGVVTGRYGTIGEVFFLNQNFWPLNTTLWVSDFHGNCAKYVYYLLQTIDYRSHSGKSGVPGVNRNDLHSEIVSIPTSVTEQKHIAEVLSDSDDLIQSLERFISKKRAIKQGMMQELLTGRTRLSGFTKPWKNISIARHSHLKARIGWQGLTTGEYLQSGSYKLIGGTDFRNARIDWESASFVSKWRFDQDRNIQLRVNDVLITKDGTIGKVAIVDSLPFPATLNSGVFVVRPIQGSYESRFLYWLLRSSVFENFIASLSAGSTINHLYQKDLITLTLAFPEDASEQREISSVLDDAESEIRVLEARLETARNIKQGMMQELLTGRTRLPVEEVSS